MQCFNCGFQNPVDANFCQNCGTALKGACSNCGTLNDPTAKFCKNCGQPQDVNSTTTIPPSTLDTVTRRDLSAGMQDGERRVLTMLFCDIKGTTALAEQLDPEEWADIMDGAFERLIAATTRYEGTIARLMGDAILAFFGAPVAHEDDPYRAVRAALDIVRDFHPYQVQTCERLKSRGIRVEGAEFEGRVGINTGLVVVGRVGSGEAIEYTAMGDAANLAARMEETAQPGTIQISHDTYKLVAPLVEVEPLGQIRVKGKHRPVPTYRVLGLKARPRSVRGIAGIDAPLIGRSRELHTLRQGLERLSEGQGQIISLIGDAGLGKSRLVRELNAELQKSGRLDGEPDSQGPEALNPAVEGQVVSQNGPTLGWYEAASLSFETTQPYGLLERLMRQVSGARQGEPPTDTLRKIDGMIGDLPLEHQPLVARALEALFALIPDREPAALTGQELRQALLDGMLAFGRAVAASSPTVVVLEDIHWADQASLELLMSLFALCDEVPLLFLLVFRPDRKSPTWAVKQFAETEYPHRYTEIQLQPLTPTESDSLVDSLLAIENLPVEVATLIRDKSEGNPFFVEEIVRELMESGAVAPGENGAGWRLVSQPNDIHIPDSLQALIIARMDRLEAETRRTLQLAAVIGRSFYYRVLMMITERIRHLDQDLRTLQQVGMIREVARKPELEYIFKHVLTQEAAYNAILLRQRRLYHRRTGEVMEQIFADQLEKFAPLLAHHFYQAEDSTRALKYFTIAAESAARMYANTEAIEQFSRALEVGRRIKLDPVASARLHRGRGLAFETRGDFDQALADHQTAFKLARQAGDQRVEWRALLDLGKLWAARDYQETERYFQQALTLSRRLEDPEALAHSLNRMGNWLVNAERPLEGIRHHQEAIEIFQQNDDPRGVANTHDLLGMAHFLAGDLIKSTTYFWQAVQAFHKLENRAGLVSSLTTLALRGPSPLNRVIFTDTGVETTLAEAQEVLGLALDMGWRAGECYARWVLACNYGVAGRFDAALEAGHHGLTTAREIQHRQWMCGSSATLGVIYCDLFALDEAESHLEEALSLAHEVSSANWINQSSGNLAAVQVYRGKLEGAEATLKAVLSEDTPAQTPGQRLCWQARAELAIAQNDPRKALAIANRLVETAANLTPDLVITRLWKLRAEALIAMGQSKEAESLLRAAAQNAEALGDRNALWQVLAALGRLYTKQTHLERAESELASAREVYLDIAESISEHSMRKNFLYHAEQLVTPG